jgi:hypothetical protein
MPRYNINGKVQPNVSSEKAWVVIPVESNENTTPINQETYLIQPRVLDYILLLEEKIQGDLPKLKINSITQ